jgi:nucleotide sugar dehydrogenase
MDYSIGIIGVGVLGKAILETFISIKSLYIKCYDKYRIDNKNITINNHIYHDIYVSKIEDLIHCNILFLCLPTEYDTIKKEYNKKEIDYVFYELAQLNYKGILLLKSTVEPKTTYNLSQLYPQLTLIHNPEFLTARTATSDFISQKHIVLGLSNYNNHSITYIKTFFETYFKDATISICSSDESESMKLFCNSFYATKIQYFTEVKLLCDKMDIEYNNVIELMLKNGWINPMHTTIPGHDGLLSFGGKCLPKDINALSSLCNTLDSPHEVIKAVVNENNRMRNMDL